MISLAYADKFVHEYRQWILDLTCSWCSEFGSYQKLMEKLYSRSFYAVVDRDNNRIEDGKNLRLKFVEGIPGYDYRDVYLYLYEKPCSVLELMAALADRCEQNIMYDPNAGDRTYIWFYEMLQSTHLSEFSDDRYNEEEVDKIVDNLLNRNYAPNGEGGLFTMMSERYSSEDMRELEIWYQMCRHLDEVLGV